MRYQVQLARGTAAEWTAANPILADGEPGVETDTHKMKIGDGVTAWNSLAYSSGSGGEGGATDLTAIVDTTTVTISSSTGNNAVLTAATATDAGVMSAAQAEKLAGIATGAGVTPTAATNAEIATASETSTRTISPAQVALGAAKVAKTLKVDRDITERFFGFHQNALGAGETANYPAAQGLTTSIFRTWDAYPYVAWGAVNTADGVYDWSGMDSLMTYLQPKGCDIIYTLGWTPDWVTAGNFATKMATFITAFIARYPTVNYIELWNEPDTTNGHPSIFADLATWRTALVAAAAAVYTAIKAANSSIKVISPSCQDVNGADWLDTNFLSIGGDAYCDVIGFHGYLYNEAPETIKTLISSLNAVVAKYPSLIGKPLYNTEYSWGPRGDTNWGWSDTEARRIAWQTRHLVLSAALGVSRQAWYSYAYTTAKETDGTAFGGLWNATTATMSNEGIAFREVMSWLIGAHIVEYQVFGDVHTVLLTRQGAPTCLIAWDGNSSSIHTTSWRISPHGYVRQRTVTGAVTAVADGDSITLTSVPVMFETLGSSTLDGVHDGNNRLAMTSSERTKLSGIAAGAQVNPTDLDGVPDSSTRLALTTTERANIAVAVEDTGVIAGSYTNATFTVLANGRITSASNGTSSSTLGLWYFGAPSDPWTVYDLTSSLPSAFTHSRGTTAYLEDANGDWQLIAADSPLISYKGLTVVPAITVPVNNTALSGAVVGTIGGGGSLPTGWTNSSLSGITQEVVSISTRNNLTWVKMRVSGTFSGTANTKGRVMVESSGRVGSLSSGDRISSRYFFHPITATLYPYTCGLGLYSTGTYTGAATNKTAGYQNDVRFTYTTSSTLDCYSVIFFTASTSPSTFDETFEIAAPQVYKAPYSPDILLLNSTTTDIVSNAEVVSIDTVPDVPFSIVFNVMPCFQYSATENQVLCEFVTDASNYILVYRDPADRYMKASVVVSGAVVDTVNSSYQIFDETLIKVGISLTSSAVSLTVNGRPPVSSTATFSTPVPASIRIGADQSGKKAWWGWIKDVSVASDVDSSDVISKTASGATDLLRGLNFSGAEFTSSSIPGVPDTDYFWPTASNYSDFSYLIGLGVGVVRLPFRWERLQPTLGGEFDSAELSRLQASVSDLRAAGVKVILDVHNYGYYKISGTGYLIGSTTVTQAHFIDLWTRIANLYKSDTGVLFGLMNEPSGQIATSEWWGHAQAATNSIRATGATNTILVSGAYGGGAQSWVSGSNYVYAESFYDPVNNFWFEVHQYLNSNADGADGTAVNTTIGNTRIAAVQSWAAKAGVKLFLGEFGVSSDSTNKTASINMLNEIESHPEVWAGWTAWAAGRAWSDSYYFKIGRVSGSATSQTTLLSNYF